MKNNLSKTNSLFNTKEEYLAFTRAWKHAARTKTLTREDCLMRCLLLGQDIERIMPVTKSTKRLANGALECSGRKRAQNSARANPFLAVAARQKHVAERAVQGKAPLEFRMKPSWGERWVDTLQPESRVKGLDQALMQQVLDLAARDSVVWPKTLES